jgi:site-specific DNA-methyltransferase (adenine-specific)
LEIEKAGIEGVIGLPNDRQFMSIVSSRKPFGLATNVRGKTLPFEGSVRIFQFGGSGHIDKAELTAGQHIVPEWKLFIGRAHGGQGHGKDVYPTIVLGKPFIGEPQTACTETYLYVGPFADEQIARNAQTYMTTRFFRFLVLLNKPSQDAPRRVYALVPMQDFSRPWTDADLYEKYGITDEEIAFIESMIRPMDAAVA